MAKVFIEMEKGTVPENDQVAADLGKISIQNNKKQRHVQNNQYRHLKMLNVQSY
ncbi:hypothetical protein [Costertonia aggregata]|uniref:Uncharacterized protein n=1 Tax=Costertonia aggregata TaxID=343403 RepID=A0A7H9AKH9_9FLAO|nr:hypothetical protein [Costertonia aggregata]QLG43989.1 hypothetical protein HYG79_01025 [Costertonia aggregata]